MRKLVTLATMVLAVMAIGTSTASAQVEVYDDSFNLCPDWQGGSGSCTASVDNESYTEYRHYLDGQWVGSTLCEDAFELQIGGNGAGEWSSHQFTPGPTGSCSIKACGATAQQTGDGSPWAFQLSDVGGQLQAELTMCVTYAGGGLYDTYCTIDLDVSEIEAGVYGLAASNEICAEIPSGVLRITGNWTMSGGDLGEIVH